VVSVISRPWVLVVAGLFMLWGIIRRADVRDYGRSLVGWVLVGWEFSILSRASSITTFLRSITSSRVPTKLCSTSGSLCSASSC